MATATMNTQPTKSQAAHRLSLSDLITEGNKLPSRVVLHGVEGVGKTSFAANAPNPIGLMARGETGLETLIDAGQVKPTAHFPELQTWTDTLEALDALLVENHDHKTLVLDAINGFERLCHEHVCATMFNNDWGKSGFQSYMQGYDASLPEWRGFLTRLDAIRAQRKMAILCLCHTKVTPFRNPEGADYDRYQPDMHHKTWSLTHRWADIVMFANFYTVVIDEVKQGKGAAKGKGGGGKERIMFTERSAAFDAKNRNGLPQEISMGSSAAESWSNFLTAMKGIRK
jgi:hypothetical protein